MIKLMAGLRSAINFMVLELLKDQLTVVLLDALASSVGDSPSLGNVLTHQNIFPVHPQETYCESQKENSSLLG